MSEPDLQLPLIGEAAPLVVSSEIFCVFEVLGEPRAWKRPGAMIRWGQGQPYIHWYLRPEETQYRETIAWHAKAAMGSREPTSRPLAILVHAFIPIPPSWHWKDKQAARSGVVLPAGKPDADNFLKILDACTGVVWTDDCLVCDARVLKKYSGRPALRCEIREYVSPK